LATGIYVNAALRRPERPPATAANGFGRELGRENTQSPYGHLLRLFLEKNLSNRDAQFRFRCSAGKSAVAFGNCSAVCFLSKFREKSLESGMPSRRAAYPWHATIEK
jgi:hypothetical protein